MDVFTNSFSKETWYQKYKFTNDECVEDTWGRVSSCLASVEKDKKKWQGEFYDILHNFKFVPGGRITSNAGTGLTGTSFLNCFVHGFEGYDQDSIEGIYTALLRQAQILKSEGGYGFCADVMRPNGAHIVGIANQSPGAVKFLELWDKSSEIITAGSNKKSKKNEKNFIRKGAQMVTMSCWNPDIIDFITAKKTPGRLTKFNMSVLCTDKFMKAVEDDRKWNLFFPNYEAFPKKYKEVWDGDINKWLESFTDEELQGDQSPLTTYHTFDSARELWDLIMDNTYNRNEPGVLFVDTMNRMNNLNWLENISSTNPCLTGETLVYTADGRGNIPIQQLAQEGCDVPVFCMSPRGKLDIRYMRHPRKTGQGQPIYKISLDDGSSIRCTTNHKFLNPTNDFKKVSDLKIGDSLKIFTKFEASLKDIFPKCNSRSQDYYWLNAGKKTSKSEHRLIYEFHNNIQIPKGHVIHHKNFNGQDNHPNNLQLMSVEAHDKYHGDLMRGDNNPMRRAQHEWSAEKWKKYRENMSRAVSQEKNGRYLGVTNDELRVHALKLTKIIGNRFSNQNWIKYAKENNLPSQFSKWREDHFGGVVGLAKWAALELNLENIHADPRSQRKYKELSEQGYNCEFINNQLYVIKLCEVCSTTISVRAEQREISICSGSCHSQLMLNKNKLRSPEQILDYANRSRKAYKVRKESDRIIQLQTYSDLEFELKRPPMRKEWEEKCRSNNIRHRLGKTSPFQNFGELRKNAKLFNHKIVNIEFDGYEDVYNGTVDEYHNFLVGGFPSSSSDNKSKWQYLCNLQCGEQILPINGSCLLGSINLVHFINPDTKDWDYDKLKKVIHVAVRLMDNVNDITNVPLEAQKIDLLNKRRIGLGGLGYGSALLMARIRYGSKKALELTEDVMRFITNEAYVASAMLAKEKGAFPLYDAEKYLSSNFVKQLDPETMDMIAAYGIRNSHLTSIQPTGNSSCFANLVSGGLEPVFLQGYFRTSIQPTCPPGLHLPYDIDWDKKTFSHDFSDDTPRSFWEWIREGDEDLLATIFEDKTWKFDRSRGLLKEEWVEDYGVSYLKKENKWNPEAKWAAFTTDLDVDAHVNTMSIFAKWVDSAISKTINLSNDYPYDDFKQVYTKAWKKGIKGFTTYRAGTMTNVLSATSSLDKIEDLSNIERPKELDCDVHHISVKGEKYFVLVGLCEDQPYEIFAGKNGFIDKKVSKGKIIRMGRPKGLYKAVLEDGLEISPINATCSAEEDALTRMASLGLRLSASNILLIVQQLEKVKGDMHCFAKSMSRAIKKYIPDGAKEDGSCPECSVKDGLIRQEGCITCIQCGYSACL